MVFYVKVTERFRNEPKTYGPFKTFDQAVDEAQRLMTLVASEHNLANKYFKKLEAAVDEIKDQKISTIGDEEGNIVITFEIIEQP